MKEKNRKTPLITYEQPPIDDTIPIGLISDPLLSSSHHSNATNMSFPILPNSSSLPCFTVKDYLAHCNISSTLLNNPIVEALCSNIEKTYQKKLEERTSCSKSPNLSTLLSQLIQINGGQEIGFSIISNITIPSRPHRIIIRRRSFRLIHVPQNEKDFSSSIEKEIYDETYFNVADKDENQDSKNKIKKEIRIKKVYYDAYGTINEIDEIIPSASTDETHIKKIYYPQDRTKRRVERIVTLPSSQVFQYQDYEEKEL